MWIVTKTLKLGKFFYGYLNHQAPAEMVMTTTLHNDVNMWY